MSGIELRTAGERAVMIDVPEGSAARVARAIMAEHLDGIADVVPGHSTVLVRCELEPPRAVLRSLAARAVTSADLRDDVRLIEVPVTYDGADLELVAQLSGLTVDRVVAAHAGAEYTVAFLGFAPGFGYLVGGDERLHVPRREEPRQRVPAGSVAVAGPYSGVYPRESPGGWRLLGTTAEVLFDPSRQPPALLAAGDRVRFVPA